MGDKYDVLLKNGCLVDPLNHVNEKYDLAIKNGQVEKAAPNIQESATEIIDLEGLTIVPGIVDLHIHASKWLGGRHSHYMMAKAGVTTALDMAGPIDSTLEIAQKYGAGLNLACLHYVRPGDTVSGKDPSKDEIKDMMAECMSKGAFGVKILGGHYPITPEAVEKTISVASEFNAYVAFHAGTTEKKSDIQGCLEAIDLAQGRPLHLAHINSYCRGQIMNSLDETREAILALKENTNIVSESYLSPMNGTSAKCSDGIPESLVTGKSLAVAGYEATEKGLEKAIFDGWARINVETDKEVVLAVGEEALAFWRSRQTNTVVSFKVNPPEPRLVLATTKREKGDFVVDCISTDGGGIPRNTTVAMGLALVKLGALSMEDFVIKTSTNPCSILGIPQKGHLGCGADADISVLDPAKGNCRMSLVKGKVVMREGEVVGSGTTILSRPQGEKALKEMGFETQQTEPLLMRLPRQKQSDAS